MNNNDTEKQVDAEMPPEAQEVLVGLGLVHTHTQAKIDELHAYHASLEQQLASELATQRLRVEERVQLLIALSEAQGDIRSAQEALARHGTAAESIHKDALAEAKQREGIARSQLTAFDEQHDHVLSVFVRLHKDKCTICEVEQSIEQKKELLKTLSADMDWVKVNQVGYLARLS